MTFENSCQLEFVSSYLFKIFHKHKFWCLFLFYGVVYMCQIFDSSSVHSSVYFRFNHLAFESPQKSLILISHNAEVIA